MKKRVLCLLVSLVMIISLLPSAFLTASAESVPVEYEIAGNNMTCTQMRNWQAPDNAKDSTLYYKEGEGEDAVYYPVTVVSDPQYYTQRTRNGQDNGHDYYNVKGNFSKEKARNQGGWLWNRVSANDDNADAPFYYIDTEKNDIHKLYYNSYSNGVWHFLFDSYDCYIGIYYYTKDLEGNAVTDSTSMNSEMNSGNVRVLTNTSNYTTVDTNDTGKHLSYEWQSSTDIINDFVYPDRLYCPLYLYSGTNDNKLAAYYEKDGYKYYIARNLRSAGYNPSVSGDLYYAKVAYPEEAIPIVDNDPIPYNVDTADLKITNPERAKINDIENPNDGLKLLKELRDNSKGSFDLKLESYSTADATARTVTEKIPSDFVIVVDQSGSMAINDMATGYTKESNQVTLEDIAENQYFTKGTDGKYYRVYPVRNYLYEYFAPGTKWTEDIVKDSHAGLSWFQSQEEGNFDVANQYYFRDDSSQPVVYRPITVSIRGEFLTYDVKLRYKNNQDDDVYFDRGDTPEYRNLITGRKYTSSNWATYWAINGAVDLIYPNHTMYTYSTFAGIKTGMYINYPMYKRHVGYDKLCYRDANGEEHVLSTAGGQTTAEFCNAKGEALTTAGGTTRMLYKNLYKPTSTERRLDSLNTALDQFAQTLANERDSYGAVDNRVAIVGFSSGNDGRLYNNTEVLSGQDLTTSAVPSDYSQIRNSAYFPKNANYNGAQYLSQNTGYNVQKLNDAYGTALINANATRDGKLDYGSVNDKLTEAIDALTAYGGTQPEDGLVMAKKIFEARDNSNQDRFTMRSTQQEVERNKIVIFFTDGRPGNQTNDDQYKEANEVVEAAYDLKHYTKPGADTESPATIFTIGVFGESDGNPLTYVPLDKDEQGNYKHIFSEANPDLEFEDGWVDTYHGGSYYYYLKRQWRPNNNAYYGATATDTIFDYMSVVSSNYPDATDYVGNDWLIGQSTTANTWLEAISQARGSSIGENQYYRMASSQETLVAAFLQAATTVSTITTETGNGSLLDQTAELRDEINTEDFDIANATYSVFYVPIKVDRDSEDKITGVSENSAEETRVILSNQPVPSDGKIVFKGYSWVENHVSAVKDEGYKLRLVVNDLVPRTFNQWIKSNNDPNENEYAAGIYARDSEDPVLSVESPKLWKGKSASTYIVDFNNKMIVATEATDKTNEVSPNGTFNIENNGNATYQLDSGAQKNGIATINSQYTEADYATITGKHVDDGPRTTVQPRVVRVIPASSIYYSDKLADAEAVHVEDGSGYNAEISGVSSTQAESVAENSVEGNVDKKNLFFTFYGTGIDIYCTTHADGKYVQAALYKGTYEDVHNGDGSINTANRVPGSAKLMKNYSSENIYNVPTLSFTGYDCDTYTVVIALNNSEYKLDGVRVYNPTSESILSDTSEAKASFLNLRALLLNDKNDYSVESPFESDTTPDPEIVNGILYLDNASQLQKDTTDAEGNVVSMYTTAFEAYKKNGPKNEIYLDKGQGVTFQLNKNELIQVDEETQEGSLKDGVKMWVGISAPKDGTGRVKINGNDVDVTSYVDMYYPISRYIDEYGSVIIVNDSDSMISLTDIKITGIELAEADGQSASTNGRTRAKLFAPVNRMTIMLAANDGTMPADNESVDDGNTGDETGDSTDVTDTPDNPGSGDDDTVTTEPEVTPEPSAQPGNTSVISRVINNLVKTVQSLFKGLFRR